MRRANLTLNFLLFKTLNLSSAQELELPVPSNRVTSGYETLGLWLPRQRGGPMPEPQPCLAPPEGPGSLTSPARILDFLTHKKGSVLALTRWNCRVDGDTRVHA